MRNVLKNILVLLLSSTAVLSCSVGMVNDPALAPGMDLSITVTGTASDIDTNWPLEEIRIILHAEEAISNGTELLIDKTTYTDNNGRFSITMEGFRSPTSFTISADDPNGVYGGAQIKIPLVTWDFDYNISGGTFYVNDCNFHLKKM